MGLNAFNQNHPPPFPLFISLTAPHRPVVNSPLTFHSFNYHALQVTPDMSDRVPLVEHWMRSASAVLLGAASLIKCSSPIKCDYGGLVMSQQSTHLCVQADNPDRLQMLSDKGLGEALTQVCALLRIAGSPEQ